MEGERSIADDADDANRSVEAIGAPMVQRLVAALEGGASRLFVGLDGRSGSGKSTVAAHVAAAVRDRRGVHVAVVEGDDFYAGGSAATWDARTAAEKAAHVIDWHRQREVLLDLRDRGEARWQPFDWEAPEWDADEVPLAGAVHVPAGPVVILEGAYSCRPELADLLDLRVLLDPPDAVRRRQLLAREGDEYRADWEHRWAAAEDAYFDRIAPPSTFDLVLGAWDHRSRR